MGDRVKFQDLYDLYPSKWVVTINEELKNGQIETCEVYGIFDTEDGSIEAIKEAHRTGIEGLGLSKMVKEEDVLL